MEIPYRLVTGGRSVDLPGSHGSLYPPLTTQRSARLLPQMFWIWNKRDKNAGEQYFLDRNVRLL